MVRIYVVERVRGGEDGVYDSLEREISIENRFPRREITIFRSPYCGYFLKFYIFNYPY